MAFVAARCPQCGGELQLDNVKELGFCIHCGTKIVVQEAIRAVRVDNFHMVETWMKMGHLAANAGNFKEAYDYFTKVVEIDPNNWDAIFSKGRAASWQSNYGNPRILELIQGIGLAQKIIIQLNLPENQRAEAWKNFARAINEINLAYVELIREVFDNHKDVTQYQSIVDEAFKKLAECIGYLEIGLGLVDGMDDEEGKSIRLGFLKGIYYLCQEVCGQHPGWPDGSIVSKWNWGLLLETKQPFIDRFDEVGYEIRKIEPEFEKDGFIDRLETPLQNVHNNASEFTIAAMAKYNLIGKNRDAENIRLQKEADEKIRLREAGVQHKYE